MGFFFIACSKKDQSEDQCGSLVNSTLAGQKNIGEHYKLQVDKMRFKIGTLDQLMELNESLNKVDAMLDGTVKKIEKQAKELLSQDLMIEVSHGQKMQVEDYIKNFKWEDNKYPRARSLVELSGMIAERMRTIDGDLKKVQDELNDVKNQYGAVSKGKDSASFTQKDLGEIIYNSKIDPDRFFVEKHGSENLTTLVYIQHKTKLLPFQENYEKILEHAAVPRSLKFLELEDKEGYQLHRVVVLSSKVENYITEARKHGFTLKKFAYDLEKYREEQMLKTKLENKIDTLKSSLSSRSYYAFSELFIALMHLKVMRTFIDGVLRFGIPPNFFLAVVRPNRGLEKRVQAALNDTFADASMKEMYGSKEETNDTEDFFSYVCISLTSPLFLQ